MYQNLYSLCTEFISGNISKGIMANVYVQSTLVTSKSKGLSEIFRDVRTLKDLQNWGKNKSNNHMLQMNI